MKLFVSFVFPMNDQAAFEIVDTNINRATIISLLKTYIQDCIGAGADEREPNVLEVYNILLKIDLTDDTITVRSNTGNKALTVGILMDILRRMGDQNCPGRNQCERNGECSHPENLPCGL